MGSNSEERFHHLLVDALIISLSVWLTIYFLKDNRLTGFLSALENIKLLGSFTAGVFFVSIFTITPATAILIELLKRDSLLVTAFFGALGALFGNLILFELLKNSLIDDINYVLKAIEGRRLRILLHRKIFRWLTPLLGVLITISPVPDELGLMLLGLSKTKLSFFIPFIFTLHFLGILFLGLTMKLDLLG